MTRGVRKELTIEQVQRWVISFLILAVAAFPLGALLAVDRTIVEDGRAGDAVILLGAMAVIGVVACGAVRIVHRRSIVTPWLMVGLLPAVVAAVVVF